MRFSLKPFLVSVLALSEIPGQVFSRVIPPATSSICNGAGQNCQAGQDIRGYTVDARHSKSIVSHAEVSTIQPWLGAVDINTHSLFRRGKTSTSSPGSPNSPEAPASPPEPDSPSGPIDLSPDGEPDSNVDPSAPIDLSPDGEPDSNADPSAPIDLSPDGEPDSNVDPSAPIDLSPEPNAGSESLVPSQPAEATTAPAPTKVEPSTPDRVANDNGLINCNVLSDKLARRCPSADNPSGDNSPEAGGFGQDSRQDGQPVPPPRVQPNSWFDQTDQTPRPAHRAQQSWNEKVNLKVPDQEYPSLAPRYRVEEVEFDEPFFDGGMASRDGVETIFRNLGFEIEESGSMTKQVFSAQSNDFIHQTSFSLDGRAIFAEISEKTKDINRPEDQLNWSKLTFAQYLDFTIQNGIDLKELGFIARNTISNVATKRTMKTAFERMGLGSYTKDTVTTLRFDAAPGSPEEQGFDALSRSDNVNGVWWMLGDYHQALGDKKIVAMHMRLHPGPVEEPWVIGDILLELG